MLSPLIDAEIPTLAVPGNDDFANHAEGRLVVSIYSPTLATGHGQPWQETVEGRRQPVSGRRPTVPAPNGHRRGRHFPPDLLRPSHLLLRSRALFLVSLTATIALATLAALNPELLLEIDRPISEFLNDEDWVPFFRVVTEIGRPWAVAVLSVIAGVLLWRRCRAFAIALPATALSALVIDVALKLLISRTRPPFGIGATEDPTSFPSGHVILGVIFLGLLVPIAYLVTERRWVYRAAIAAFVFYVPIVMVSRVVIGAHWFTDVIGSFFIGALFLLGAEYLVGTKFADEHCDCRLHSGNLGFGVRQRGWLRE